MTVSLRTSLLLGLAGLGQLFTVLLGNTLASSGLVPGFYIWMGGLSSRLNFCAIYGFGFAQTFAVTMIAINRFTAYLFPLRHMKVMNITSSRSLFICTAIMHVLSRFICKSGYGIEIFQVDTLSSNDKTSRYLK